MVRIEQNKAGYTKYFKDYPVFRLYLNYGFNHEEYTVFVDRVDEPLTLIVQIPPAFVLAGDPAKIDEGTLKKVIPSGSWIISPGKNWDDLLRRTYGNGLQTYPRMLFDESGLKVSDLLACQKPLPPELKIVKVESEHLREGMLKTQIIDKFFRDTDFLVSGFGLVLTDTREVVHGFAVTNYPIANHDEIDVTYRVGYDDFTKYRNQGIGTTLVSRFLVEAIQKGYRPLWDAANAVSCHIAKKLGYREKLGWNMHRVT